jgi:histidine triad (HIT) family protein
MHTDVDCIFCKIALKQIPAKMAGESERVVAFHDLNPMAPTHVLIIPKEHVASVKELSVDTAPVLADMTMMAKRLATELGLDDAGYRIIMNTGKNAGQSVFHLHMHLLGGRPMQWPPG